MTDPENYRLCYTEGRRAWFTDVDDFDDIHADDWDDGYRQGAPYEADEYDLLRVCVDGPVEDANLEVPPERINAEELAWLKASNLTETPVTITAKCTLPTFIDLVHEAGGEVYLPAERVEWPE